VSQAGALPSKKQKARRLAGKKMKVTSFQRMPAELDVQ
jgi:hypothetical protein